MTSTSRLVLCGFAVFQSTACGSDSNTPNEPAKVSVAAVDPVSGPLAGGANITIAGTNFVDITTVTIGGIAVGSRTVVNSTQITGTTPAASSAGTKDVIVTSSTRGTGTCSGCFTYLAAATGSATQLAAGWDHTCVLVSDGAAYCWGNNNYGALGNGSTVSSRVPVAVSGGLKFTTLAAGSSYTCGLTSDGTAYCWGLNQSGELGTGSTANSVVPIAVSGGLKFTTLVATLDHTCGLTSSGSAYCWGKNDFGQGGNGTTQPSSQPGSVTPTAVSGGLIFTSIDAGGYHTCGITSSGATYCWGLNQSGELGNGLQGGNVDASTPVAVAGNPSFAKIATGFYHSCGLTSAGVASCWGSNLQGGLGNGSASGPDNCPTYPNTGACSVRPIAVVGGLHFDALALGGYHSCGLISGGVAYCWGANGSGQLGNGSMTSTASPIAVAGGFAFKGIAAGITSYTCGITTSGAVYCWGKNDVGQLGNGSTSDSSTPGAVTGLPPV